MHISDRPELFGHFLEHLPLAAAMVDLQRRYLAVSRQWLQVYGLEDSQIIGCQCDMDRFSGMSSHPWRDDTGEIGGTFLFGVPCVESLANHQEYLRESATAELNQTIQQLPNEIACSQLVEAQLQSGDRRYQTLAELSPVGIYHTDKAGNVLYANDRWLEFSGLILEEAKGDGWVRSIHPGDRERVLAQWQQATLQNVPYYQCEYRLINPNGKITPVLAQSVAERNKGGEIVGYVGTVTDISALKALEKQLVQQQALLNTFIANAPVGMVIIDSQFRYVQINEILAEIDGISVADHIGKTVWEVVPELATKLSATYQQVLTTGEAILNFEFSGETPQQPGIVRNWMTSYIPLRLENDTPIAIGGIVVEITARKRAEAALIESEESFRKIFDYAPIAIALSDYNTNRLVKVNRAFCEMLGYSESELLEMSVASLSHPEDMSRELELGVQIQTGDLTSIQVEKRFIAKNREIVLGSLNKTLLRDSLRDNYTSRDGNSYWLSMVENIGERKRYEQALGQSEARFRSIAQREELLNRLTNQIRQSLNLEQILETTVNEILSLLQLDRCIFSWYRPDALAPAWEGVKEAKIPEIPSILGIYLATEIGSFGQKILDYEEIRVDNIATLDDPIFQRLLLNMGIVSILAVPVFTRSGEVGSISCMCYDRCRSWRDSEVELLRSVAGQLAIAIDQAQLYEETATAAATATAKSLELEQTLRELRQTQSHLIQSEKMYSLGQLVAGVAHEINNPVSFIYGNITPAQEYASALLKLVQLYQNTYPHPTAEIEDEIENIDLYFIIEDLPKLLSSMKMGAERIQEIVRSLRNFSRLDEAQMKEVDIHSGIESTLMILNSRLRAKPDRPAIEIIKEYDNLPQIECYPGQLNQVFMNLISNAIDALEEWYFSIKPTSEKAPNNTILIKTERLNQDFASIRIADNGCGMSESVQQKLFDPFFTTKPVGKGTGLGLAISYQIVVEKHKGKLYCVSQVGQGTEFIIEIPIRQSY